MGTERATSRLTHVVADKLHFLEGHHRLGLSSSLLLGDTGLLIMWEFISLVVIDTNSQPDRQTERCHSTFITQSQKWHPLTNYCRVPFIRSASVNPPILKKGGSHKNVNTKK